MADLIERLEAMLKQESSEYKTVDYLMPACQMRLATETPIDSCGLSTADSSQSSGDINESWREKICEWSYQVIDHFDFSREVVMVSMNLLDRFLASRTVNKKVFQLAAMTCLFIAIKLNEPGKLTMLSMIELSRGYFKVNQMAAMEVSILRTLKWSVHPPTSFCFTRYLLYLLPHQSISLDARHDSLELSRFLTELSTMDYFFVLHRPSTVALAAILNAMEDIPSIPYSAQLMLAAQIKHSTSMNPYSAEVHQCRARLRVHYDHGGYARPSNISTSSENRDSSISPVCVTHGVAAYYHGVASTQVQSEEKAQVNQA